MKMGGGGDPGGTSSAIIINTNSNSNSNKRKIHDEILEEGLPVPKHACLDNNKNHHHHPLFHTTCLDSVMSLSNDSKHDDNDHDVSSSSSVNWSGATTTTSQDSIYNSNHHFDYPCPSFDQQTHLDCGDMMMMTSIPEYYQTNHQSQNHGDGDLMFCSNAAAAGEEASSTDYVLSSGRWNTVNNQDTEQITEKLTIDKEFEQYFSMLML